VSVGREANLLALAKIRMAWLDGDGSASPTAHFSKSIHCRKCRPGLILLVYLFLFVYFFE